MYDSTEEVLGLGKGNDYLVLLGDWNAVVGIGQEGSVTGHFGLGKRNERGDMLVDFCKRRSLTIANICFEHHQRRRYTRKAPGDTRCPQRDYIMVRERYKNSVKNAMAYPGADCNSDHNLVVMQAKLRLKRVSGSRKILKWDKKTKM